MKKPKLIMTVLKEDIGYSANILVGEQFIATQGDDFDELKVNILDAVNLSFEDYGFNYDINEITLKPDLQSFFDFYKVINTKTLSNKINMGQDLLTLLITGKKNLQQCRHAKFWTECIKSGKNLLQFRTFYSF